MSSETLKTQNGLGAVEITIFYGPVATLYKTEMHPRYKPFGRMPMKSPSMPIGLGFVTEKLRKSIRGY